MRPPTFVWGLGLMALAIGACSPAVSGGTATSEPTSSPNLFDAMMLSPDSLALVAGAADLQIRYGPDDFPPGHLPPVCGKGDERFDEVVGGREYLVSADGEHLIVGLHVIGVANAGAAMDVYERAHELFAGCSAFEEGAAVAGPRWWAGDLLLEADGMENMAAGDQAFLYQAVAHIDRDGELDDPARVCWSYARTNAVITVMGLFEDASAPVTRCHDITAAAAQALGDGDVSLP